MNKSESITALAAALSKAQGEMPVIAFDSVNPFLKNKFASLGTIIDHSRPILAKYGLCLCQLPVSGANGKVGMESILMVGVESILMHESGEWISERILLPLSEEKGKSLAQVAGSVTTYLKRYSWASLLGLYAENDDDGSMGQGQIQETKQLVAPIKMLTKAETAQLIKAPAPVETDTEELKRARFLTLFAPYGPYATEVFRKEELVLPTEDYLAIGTEVINRFKKFHVDALLAQVKMEAGVSDNVPESEPLPPEIANMIVPIPRKGMKRDDYLKNPDTIGLLYLAAGNDEDLARRLFGLVSHWEPSGWVGRDGKARPPSQVDVKFREALDRFAEWRDKKEGK